MLCQILFLLPPFLSAVAISCTDVLPQSHKLSLFISSLIIAIAVYGISHPPSDNALVNYVNGFLLSWHLVWSMNILFVYDIRSLRRLQMKSLQGCHFCYWEPLRDTAGWHRLSWGLDLSTNFRGLGWMSTSSRDSWPSLRYKWRPTTSYGLPRRLQKLALVCIIFGLARRLVHQPSGIALCTFILLRLRRSKPTGMTVDMLAIGSCLYALMDGVHTTASIIAVYVLGPGLLGTWGRPELYPPLFGSCTLSDLGNLDLKGE